MQTLTQSAFHQPGFSVNLTAERRDLFGSAIVGVAPPTVSLARSLPLKVPPGMAIATAASAVPPPVSPVEKKPRKRRQTAKEGKESKSHVVKPLAPELASLTAADMCSVFVREVENEQDANAVPARVAESTTASSKQNGDQKVWMSKDLLSDHSRLVAKKLG